MTDVMQGIRILEAAEHTFVPAASAVLSDWGADVIKVEHHERGDAMRGLGRTGMRRRAPYERTCSGRTPIPMSRAGIRRSTGSAATRRASQGGSICSWACSTRRITRL